MARSSTPTRRHVLGAAAAAVPVVLAGPALAIEAGDDRALLALEPLLVEALQRKAIAEKAHSLADKAFGKWKDVNPPPPRPPGGGVNGTKEAYRTFKAALEQYELVLAKWKARQEAALLKCRHRETEVLAEQAEDAATELCWQIEDTPAMTIEGLKCKARMSKIARGAKMLEANDIALSISDNLLAQL